MFFQNLGILELLGLFSAVSGLVVALYLLDRSKRRLTVSTLRFWTAAQQIPEKRHRKRIQQPWSLILQLIGIALLLLAAAQLKWGNPATSMRDHILLLDSSAWMGADGSAGTLMDEAKRLAIAYVRSLPSSDRVMVVRAEAFPSPLTGMESNRGAVEAAIRNAQPGAAGLDLAAALGFAQRVRGIGSQNSGEVIFAGAGRHHSSEALPKFEAGTLRVLPVEEPVENCGLRKVGLRRSPAEAGVWEVFVTARNQGRTPRSVVAAVQFGNAPAGSRTLQLNPNSEASATFQIRTRAAGWVEVRLLTKDAFPRDDRVVLELPADRPLRVAIYSHQPEALRPLFSADPRLEPRFLDVAAWNPKPDADIVVLDRFAPPSAPAIPAIWIAPPEQGSPVRVARRANAVALSRWRSDHAIGAGLHTEDVKLESAEIFAPAQGDIPIAESPLGPVALARNGAVRLVALGFHPLDAALRYELATPLLFANIMQWLAPESFRLSEYDVGAAGSRELTLASDTAAKNLEVLDENARPVPFSVRGRSLRFFSAVPGTVRVRTPGGEIVQSLALPEVPDARLDIPRNAKRGVPRTWPVAAAARELWPYLAVLGALVLLLEWILFGQPIRPNWRWLAWFGERRAS